MKFRFSLSYRDLEEMITERGVEVDLSTIYRWVQYYASKILDKLKWYWKPKLGHSWRVDETYIKIKGRWTYLYRALDKSGNMIDFYLSLTRNSKAAKRFLCKALNSIPKDSHPKSINTYKNPTYGKAIKELKSEGQYSPDLKHRQVKYLNNIIESDHGKLKRLINPTLGFKSMRTAAPNIKGFEVMRIFKKGRFGQGTQGEINLLEQKIILRKI